MVSPHQAYGLIYGMLDRQAHVCAFVDNFNLFGWLALGCIPLIFLLKRVRRGHKPALALVE